MNRALLRHIDIVGVNFGGFLGVDETYPRECAREIARLVEAGLVRPIVGGRYALGDGAQALSDLAQRRATGKLVIQPRAG
jgi:NADPH2:quinone reductase